MSDIAIRVENLSKMYRIGAKEELPRSRSQAVRSLIASPFAYLSRMRRPPTEEETLWALRDVSFEVKQGEVIGIIGRNGAGKSTLLKILSRITDPSAGEAQVFGRVGSLLEVGTGFHPELTGRENIYLNGAVLGMKRAEIDLKFDEIVAFSEVEKFLDTPVKRYSSGMYVRLAFAVAAHLEPQILLVDEVLAVGDAAFQKKCLGKMGDVAKEGRTVLFVSHNMAAIQSLCGHGITLQNGSVQKIGTQFEAVASYLASLDGSRSLLSEREDRAGTGEIRVDAIDFVNRDGIALESAVCGQDIGIRLHFTKKRDAYYYNIIASLILKTHLETPVFLHHNRLTGDSLGPLPEKGFFELRIRRLPLPPGMYRIGYSLMQDGECIDGIGDAADLIVSTGDFFGSSEVPPSTHGVCLVDGRWSMEPVLDDTQIWERA